MGGQGEESPPPLEPPSKSKKKKKSSSSSSSSKKKKKKSSNGNRAAHTETAEGQAHVETVEAVFEAHGGDGSVETLSVDQLHAAVATQHGLAKAFGLRSTNLDDRTREGAKNVAKLEKQRERLTHKRRGFVDKAGNVTKIGLQNFLAHRAAKKALSLSSSRRSSTKNADDLEDDMMMAAMTTEGGTESASTAYGSSSSAGGGGGGSTSDGGGSSSAMSMTDTEGESDGESRGRSRSRGRSSRRSSRGGSRRSSRSSSRSRRRSRSRSIDPDRSVLGANGLSDPSLSAQLSYKGALAYASAVKGDKASWKEHERGAGRDLERRARWAEEEERVAGETWKTLERDRARETQREARDAAEAAARIAALPLEPEEVEKADCGVVCEKACVGSGKHSRECECVIA